VPWCHRHKHLCRRYQFQYTYVNETYEVKTAYCPDVHELLAVQVSLSSQIVPSARKIFAGQIPEVPVQYSAGSQTPSEAPQINVLGLKISVGHNP
jgi:hypothetical protein